MGFTIVQVLTVYFLCNAPISESKVIKPSAEADEATVIAHLEKLAASIPIERFATDTLLLQRVDTTNDISKYTLIGDNVILYERQTNDKNKPVVVLTVAEDRIQQVGTKRAFVVLRRKSDGEASYLTTLAFLRPAQDKDTENLVEIGGKKQIVEWDTYDEHVVPGRSMLTFQTLHCASAYLTPCSFNISALTPPDQFKKSEHYVSKAVNQSTINEIERKGPIVEDGADPLANLELYADLDLQQDESSGGSGRSFEPAPTYQYGAVGPPPAPDGPINYFPPGKQLENKSGVGVLGGLLSGIGGVVCGIVSFLASCADERAYNNMMPIGLAATEGMKKNGVYLGKRRRRSANDAQGLLDYPGWKTQFITPDKPSLEKVEKEIFYGFGNCPYVPTNPATLQIAGGNKEIIDFYLTVLRAQCIPWMKDFLTILVDTGFLKVANKALEVNQDLTLYKEQKLTLKEILQLSGAAEMDAFTTTFVAESSNPTKSPKSPDDKRGISQSINFITSVSIKTLEKMMSYTPHHIIHLGRHMHENLKAILLKLHQDIQNLAKCSDCSNDKELNLNDRLQVVGMMQFIKFGLGSVKNGKDTKAYFDKFYTKNFDTIEKLVRTYA